MQTILISEKIMLSFIYTKAWVLSLLSWAIWLRLVHPLFPYDLAPSDEGDMQIYQICGQEKPVWPELWVGYKDYQSMPGS